MATQHVMVPVPEELVDEVRRFITWREAGKVAERLDPAAESRLRELLDVLDPPSRDLLRAVARGVLAGQERTAGDLAVDLGSSPLEVLGRVMELNQRLTQAAGLAALLSTRARTDGDQVIALLPPAAELVAGSLRTPDGP